MSSQQEDLLYSVGRLCQRLVFHELISNSSNLLCAMHLQHSVLQVPSTCTSNICATNLKRKLRLNGFRSRRVRRTKRRMRRSRMLECQSDGIESCRCRPLYKTEPARNISTSQMTIAMFGIGVSSLMVPKRLFTYRYQSVCALDMELPR
jgi:hypothetical protein